MLRNVGAERLDDLPPAHPDAIASRRDLRRVNRLMGNCRILADMFQFARSRHAFRTLVEIGAGDGTLLLRLVQCLAVPTGTRVILVDRSRVVSESTLNGFANLGCEAEIVTADVLDWLPTTTQPEKTCIVANLFLHHFASSSLSRLLAAIEFSCAALIACEPRRCPTALFGSRMLGLLGCNDVTRHDAVLSVQAGFTANELSSAWPTGDGWSLREYFAPPFSHGFRAVRQC